MKNTSSRLLLAAIIAAGVTLASGCASPHGEGGFPEVARVAQNRTGTALRWSRDPRDNEEISHTVQAMLREPLTCDQAVRIALLNNQSLQATYEEIGISHAQLLEAGLPKNPSLRAELRFPKYEALPFEIDLFGSFIDALMIPLRKQSAAADYAAARARVTVEVIDHAAGARIAFYNAQAAAQTVELRQKIVQATGASLEAAHRLHDAGNVTDLFLLSQGAMDAQARVDLAAAQGDLQDKREMLNQQLGLWGAQTQWALSSRLPELPSTEVEPAGLESLAISQRADLQAQQAQVQVAGASLQLARRTAGFSDITAGGRIVQDPDGDLTAGPSVTIPLPIFSQGQYAIQEAAGRLAQARKRVAALAVQIRSDVRRDRDRLLLARQRAAYYTAVILPLRRQIVQQTQLEANAMVVGVFELLLARQNEIDAARESIEALRDYWVSRAELERDVGGKLPTFVPAAPPTTAPTTGATTQPAPAGSPTPDPIQMHIHEGVQP